MNVSAGLIEGNVPVRAFVSIVRRTKRNNIKLEYRPPSSRARNSYRDISSVSQNVKILEGRERSHTSKVIAMAMSVSANALGIDQT
jgi:hypothetical protein